MRAKKVICIGLVVALALGLSACSCSKDTTTTNSTSKGSEASSDYNPLDYVTLGQYKGLTVDINKADYEVTEDKIVKKEMELCNGDAEFEPDSSKTIVKKDSIVNVDYVGKLDGVPFEGGTAKNVWIDVGNNCDASSGSKYIDGFTNGVLGGRVGDSADYDITFPQNYGSANLAGKHVVFTFTINSIAKDVKQTLTDDYVKSHSTYQSAQELYDAAKKQLEDELAQQKSKDISDNVKKQVLANCTVKSLPSGLVDDKVEEYLNTYKESYKKAGQDFEKSVQNDYKLSMSEFEQQLRQEVEESLKENIVFEAIAKQENITVDQAGFDSYCKNLASSKKLTSVDELYKMYGKDSDKADGEKYLKNIYLCNKALEFCVNSATVNEV